MRVDQNSFIPGIDILRGKKCILRKTCVNLRFSLCVWAVGGGLVWVAGGCAAASVAAAGGCGSCDRCSPGGCSCSGFGAVAAAPAAAAAGVTAAAALLGPRCL